MSELSKKSYWSKFYDPDGFNKQSKLKQFFSYSMQNYEYFKIIKRYIEPDYKNIIEIGCAPGGYLITAWKKLKLIPFGVDYTEEGVKLTNKNLKITNIPKFKIFHSDIFDEYFQKEHKEQFDIVFSNGFVEHFTDFRKVINAHSNLCKKNGLVILSIPNLTYLNKFFTINDVKEICNTEIMNVDYLKKNLPNSLKLIYCHYNGGPFNIGMFFFKNKILETIRTIAFVFQRLFIDPFFIGLSAVGLDLNWKYSSPCIVVIAKKK